nr:putative retrotransposon Orf1 [Tanacetum cinerariifolium]
MDRPPFEPLRQEEFEHIVMNFLFDQEERITQLKDYMQVITEEFMEFSLKVTRRLKERIKENKNKPMKMEKITKYEPLHIGVTFRLGGVEKEISLLKLGWRVGLYSERKSKDVAKLSGLSEAKIVNSTYLTHLFWPSIGDVRFNVGNTKVKSIRNPRIKLAHRCITMTIAGRKETINRVIEIHLFYLYCIFGEGVICNIPYWLTKYLKSVKDKSVIFRGMFVTRISWSLLTNEMVSVLSHEP